ncbi:iron ABC transporter [Campylobacter sp. MIT 12-8780]|uniref:FecCD family ABC transporter permease n=2 Tax=unclassified Campylobacter TaxID=2593542 RepID=UPI00115C89C3|nr:MULTISPECIES: iron ABC transporter permease [unclassified Campylobacter]NDJ27349.1 iron ABC transporter permease [Campylobacter sp. MIT 19-121]TQR40259.1 iron ABC transporter [Campylobacter sp. MIT 12-8780]
MVFMISKRLFISFIFIIFAYIVIFLIALNIGESQASFTEIVTALFDEDSKLRTIVLESRMPRLVMAILIGMLLASSGAVTQTIFSNPIADPYIIGIASAATFGAVLAYMLKVPDYYYGFFGFACCCLFALLIFKMSKRSSIATLLIIGIAVSSFLGAFTSFFVYYIGENSFKVMAWLMGYLGLASWDKIAILLVPLCFCLLYFYAHKNELNIILSGDDEARNLGVDASKVKRNLLIVSSLAVAFGVAFSGLIGFVGLIVPHIVRLMLKNYNNILVLPLCTLLGGLFLLFCDCLARTALAPVEIPIGIITSLFGAPIFLMLALKARRFL